MRRRAAVVFVSSLLAVPAVAGERVVFGTDWKAQAEHGGFYQALATGIYARHGLDVTLRQGGPQVNHAQLLAAGRLDFNMAPNGFVPLNMVREGIPVVAVAAVFQKDPFVLIAHPGQGRDTLAALKGQPIFIGADTRVGPWLFLKARFGYGDEQIRTYTFNVAPFLANPKSVQQGYLTSEPYTIEKQGGVRPVVHLLADSGYQSYAALIQARTETVERRPDLVQRFVDASLEGWTSYLDGDPAPAHALIKKDNQDMTDDLLAYGRGQLKGRRIVTGDDPALGLGSMTEARWKAFFEIMAGQGLYPKDMAWRKAYTLRFLKPNAAAAPRR